MALDDCLRPSSDVWSRPKWRIRRCDLSKSVGGARWKLQCVKGRSLGATGNVGTRLTERTFGSRPDDYQVLRASGRGCSALWRMSPPGYHRHQYSAGDLGHQTDPLSVQISSGVQPSEEWVPPDGPANRQGPGRGRAPRYARLRTGAAQGRLAGGTHSSETPHSTLSRMNATLPAVPPRGVDEPQRLPPTNP